MAARKNYLFVFLSPISLYAVFTLLICLFTGCEGESGGGAVDLASLVPRDNDISGWTREGSLENYTSISELYDAINGEAQLYDDYGFREAVVQEFEGTGDFALTLVITDLADEEGAGGLYEEVGDGSETDTPDLGTSGRNSINPIVEIYFVEFWRDKYYVTVEINDLDNSSQEVAKEFARIVDDNILLI